jgi:hypothetical protein
MDTTKAGDGRVKRPVSSVSGRFSLWFLIALLALLLIVPFSATAAQLCTPRDVLVERLGADYAEMAVARGLSHQGVVVEVFSSGDGSTWTIVVTRPNGASCVVAAGEAWMKVEKIAIGPQS